jgi:GNAT superfamily N-acetyltransferase
MALPVTTEHGVITDLVAEALASDPVRATLLSTIGASLEDTAWAAGTVGRFAVRSSARWPVTVWGDWPAAERNDLVAALANVDDLRGLSGVPAIVDDLVARRSDPRPAHRMAQGLFRLDEITWPQGVPGRPRLAADADRALVVRWVSAFMVEAHDIPAAASEVANRAVDQGCWLWVDAVGSPVSMAARRPVSAGSARIGPVYTEPAARGHGYGSAVTAAATDAVQRDGGVPVLFTDLANPTSNKIYRALGYLPVEERAVITYG